MRLSLAWRTAAAVAVCTVLFATGCAKPRAGAFYIPPGPPHPLGTLSDPMWKTQETNAEASKFVIYQHEFMFNTARLNMGGEDHVKQIAVELRDGAPFPVLVERSMTGDRVGDVYDYPVHPNPDLDNKRREVIVRALASMGVADADERVLVSPALAVGFTDQEAEQAYTNGINNASQSGFGGFGNGFGGGFGGFGGFGGGF